MKRVVVIQARMTSTRLPGKVLMELAGRPMLSQQLRRLKACRSVDEIVIATTVNDTDTPVVELAEQEAVGWFRGSEADVLSRYVGAAKQSGADVIVRITADCPLIDPLLVDQVIDDLTAHSTSCDYSSNVMQRTYPRGLDVEAFFYDTLLRMDRLGQSPVAREHVTVVLRSEQPERYLVRHIVDEADNSALRWTVDTAQDLEMVRLLYEGLNLGEQFVPYHQILAYLQAHPHIARMNLENETWDPNR